MLLGDNPLESLGFTEEEREKIFKAVLRVMREPEVGKRCMEVKLLPPSTMRYL